MAYTTTIHHTDDGTVVEFTSESDRITKASDVLDLMAECHERDSSRMILHASSLHPDFFELKTGFAGEVLQKFSNYGLRLGIVGDFSRVTSNALRDFIRESNKHRHIVFAASVDEALTLLRS